LKKVSEDLNAGKGTAGKFLKDEELAKKIDTTMTKLAELTTGLEEGRGTVGKLFKDDTVYNNVNHVLEETQGLIKAIRENPKKYLSIKLHIF
jgi:phospholipid/cholesterol/gamma-HCH transport system substrate-binding protein